MASSEYQNNVKVEQLVQQLVPGTKLTAEQKQLFLNYSGRGQVWDPNKTGDSAELFEFYTPEYLVDLMYRLAHHYGFEGGNILEPSCANARMFAHDYAQGSTHVGFEVNPVTAKMAQLLHPDATIHNMYFEQAFLDPTRNRYTKLLKNGETWLKEYPFDLVIGNPPYGIHQNKYTGHKFFKLNFMQVEIFFLYAGLRLLKPGGILVYLTASNFLRNGNKYNQIKQEVIKVGEMVDAYRMPKVFRRTGVPTDIMVWKRI